MSSPLMTRALLRGVGAGVGRPGHGRKGLACPRTPGRFRRRGLSTSDVTGVGRARGVQNRVAAVCSGQSAHAGPRGARWRTDAAQVRAPRGLAPFPAGLSQALRPRAPHISGDPDFSDGSPANTHARSVGGGWGGGGDVRDAPAGVFYAVYSVRRVDSPRCHCLDPGPSELKKAPARG